jgi:tripartite ATP-independent transporter DctM subunit
MSIWEGLCLTAGLMGVLLALGVRVSYTLVLVGMVGSIWILDPIDPVVVGREAWNFLKSYNLTAIPLYVLMAEILVKADVTRMAYKGFATIMSPLPGGAAYANIGGSTIFAAISGSSVANAASVGTVAGLAMTEMGYNRRLTFGSIAAGGTLGILMPPSTAMIIYGGMTGESISDLFMAGVIPALVLAGLYALVVLVWGLLRPQDAPRDAKTPSASEMAGALVRLLPFLALILVVLGGIYCGVFTPTEASGIGVMGALVIAAIFRRLTWNVIWESAIAATTVTSMILLVMGGAAAISYVVGMMGLANGITTALQGMHLSHTELLLLVAALYIVLGFFIESVSLLVLTTPVVYPVLQALGVNGIWFGIYVVVLMEMALIHPPVGLNLFVLKNIPAGQTMNDIMIGALPFLFAMLLMLLLLLWFPGLALWLPSMS